MRVLLFGATGMIGQGVLRECLLDPDVTEVVAVGRRPVGQRHAKLRDLPHEDFGDFSGVDLSGFDACFFCLGVSSMGMSEADYTRVTYDYTVAAATALAAASPGAVFCFISGAGTDATEKGRSMWARVKGRAENAVQRLPFRATYIFRPGLIQPRHGIRSRSYRTTYAVLGPILPLFKALLPKYVTATDRVGLAMLRAAKHGAPKTILETSDINALAREAA